MNKIVKIKFNEIPQVDDFIFLVGMSKTYGILINNEIRFKLNRQNEREAEIASTVEQMAINYANAYSIDYPGYLVEVYDEYVEIHILENSDFEYFEYFSTTYMSLYAILNFITSSENNLRHVIFLKAKKYISNFINNLLFLQTENNKYIVTENGKKIRHQ